jgi:hypothetical protein
MKTKLLGLIAGMALLFGASFAGSASAYEVTIEQVGGNVVATGSGEIDTTGLISTINGASAFSSIWPEDASIFLGSSTENYDGYPVSIPGGPSSFGSGGLAFASMSSGDVAGIKLVAPGTSNYVIFLAQGDSGISLMDSATWDGTTIAGLGLTPGTYEWIYGSLADQTFTLDVIAPTATPLPAALPLFAGGLGGLGLLGWRRKRKAHAVV